MINRSIGRLIHSFIHLRTGRRLARARRCHRRFRNRLRLFPSCFQICQSHRITSKLNYNQGAVNRFRIRSRIRRMIIQLRRIATTKMPIPTIRTVAVKEVTVPPSRKPNRIPNVTEIIKIVTTIITIHAILIFDTNEPSWPHRQLST